MYLRRLQTLTVKKISKQKLNKKTTLQIANKLSKIKINQITERENYESLYELLIDLEIDIDDDLTEILYLIDEKFIQNSAKNKEAYYDILNG